MNKVRYSYTPGFIIGFILIFVFAVGSLGVIFHALNEEEAAEMNCTSYTEQGKGE